MKSGVVSSGQIRKLGRWDAAFNLAYQKNEARVQKLLKEVPHNALVAAALSVPFDKDATSVRKGINPRPNFVDWDDLELGLYLLQLEDAGALDAAKKQAISTAEYRVQSLSSLQSAIKVVDGCVSEDTNAVEDSDAVQIVDVGEGGRLLLVRGIPVAMHEPEEEVFKTTNTVIDTFTLLAIDKFVGKNRSELVNQAYLDGFLEDLDVS